MEFKNREAQRFYGASKLPFEISIGQLQTESESLPVSRWIWFCFGLKPSFGLLMLFTICGKSDEVVKTRYAERCGWMHGEFLVLSYSKEVGQVWYYSAKMAYCVT